MDCPKCGAQVPESKEHCIKCGNPMTGTPQHPAASGHSRNLRSMPYQPTEPRTTFLDKWFDPQALGPRQNTPASKRIYNIIWFALFMSLHMYVLVSYLVGMDMKNRTSHPPAVMLPIMAGIALVVLVFGITVIKLQITPGKIKKYSSAQDAMQHVQTFGIIGMAQIESVAIFGLTLFFMGHNVHYFYAFYAVSAITIVISRIMVEPAWRFIENNPAWKTPS